MLIYSSALVLLMSAFVVGQRPSFAGTRPIGYPETPNRTTTPDPLGNRFGEGTTQRLPIEAQGDRDLFDRLSKLPIDKQPFWLLNWQVLEEHRKNPQTYPQRPNVFVDPITVRPNTGINNNRFSTTGFVSTPTADLVVNRIDPTTISNPANANAATSDSGLGNRNGGFELTTNTNVSQRTESTFINRDHSSYQKKDNNKKESL